MKRPIDGGESIDICRRCEHAGPVSMETQQGVVFHAPLCAGCRETTVREVLEASFASLMARLDGDEAGQ